MKTVTKAIQVLENLQVPTGIDTTEVETTKKEVTAVYEFADAINIIDVKSLEGAEAFSKACSDHEKKVKKTFEKITTKAKEAKKAATEAYGEICDFIETLLAPVTEAKKLADAKSRTYRSEEQRKIAIENEKRRQEAEAEAKRIRKAEIEVLKNAGTKEAKDAAKRLEEEPITPNFIPKQSLPDAVGIIHRELWTAEDTGDTQQSLKVLIIAAANDFGTYGRFLIPDIVALNSEARTMKDQFKVPGFRAINKGSTAHK